MSKTVYLVTANIDDDIIGIFNSKRKAHTAAQQWARTSSTITKRAWYTKYYNAVTEDWATVTTHDINYNNLDGVYKDETS